MNHTNSNISEALAVIVLAGLGFLYLVLWALPAWPYFLEVAR